MWPLSKIPQGAHLRSLTEQKTGRILLLILAVSVILRVGVALYLGDSTPPAKDETSYSMLAARLADGYGYSFDRAWYPFTPPDTPTAHWSFLYTAFVAAIYAVAGVHPLAVRLVQAVLTGILLPWMVYRLAVRMQGSRGAGERGGGGEIASSDYVPLLAALVTAIYAYFVLYGAMVQTEAFFIVALLWSLERSLALAEWLHIKPDLQTGPLIGSALTLGLSLGAATLLRQSILPWVPVLFLWLLWAGYRQDKLRTTVLALSTSALTLAFLILPFTVRNYLAYGDFLLLNSNAGYAMYSAQHPLHGASFQAYAAAPLPTDLDPLPQNEAQWDRALMARGIQFVLADAGRYVLLSLSRVADYFEFWPKEDSSAFFNLGRLLSFTLFLPFMLYGIYVSVVSCRSSVAHSLLYFFVVFYSLLHILTWAMPRYRLPVDAVLIIYAAVALAHLWENWQKRRTRISRMNTDSSLRQAQDTAHRSYQP